jgi:acetolactate synthase-1/2/3 large subunit
MTRRAADLLVDCLAAHGADRVFCVPGESYLSALDALHAHNAVETIVARHESGAGFMAIADAKITGRPGITFVSRGPGATNASIAVHVAEQDAVPFILFVGQVPRHDIGRHAFQEVDYAKTFADMAKAVYVVEDAKRLPEIVARAFQVAQAPTAGPVVIVLPEDMLEDMTDAPVVEPLGIPRPGLPASLDDIAAAIAKAERPLLIAGGGLGSDRGRAALLAAAEALQVPVAASFKRQDYFPNAHPLYAGHLGFKIPKAQFDNYLGADLIVAVGTRLGETPTQGYTFPQAPVPKQTLIHVYDDAAHVGRVFQTAYPVVADPILFMEALARGRAAKPPAARAAWIKKLSDYTRAGQPWTPLADGKLDMGAIVGAFKGQLPDDAVFITDAGNFSGWLHKHYVFGPKNLMIGSIGGAMGCGMPGAVAAGLRLRDRQIITWIGDGGILMTGSELATAIQYRVPVKVFVSNNGTYGTIRMHQERSFPGRNHGTDLVNPDFAKWGEAFGAKGLTIRTLDEAPGIVADALSHDGPVVVDVRTTLDHIAPGLTISGMQK